MRPPQIPPSTTELLQEVSAGRLAQIVDQIPRMPAAQRYLHWDELRHRPSPAGLNNREWWLAEKLSRLGGQPIGLTDASGRPFRFLLPSFVLEELHQIDLGPGGLISAPEPITNPQTRDSYLMSSLMEEAITSSQFEGAVTTREVAKEMIRRGRKPRDTSEQMILNNFETMQSIRAIRSARLTPDLVFELHQRVTVNTLAEPSAAGRFRRTDVKVVVADNYGEIYHVPPPAHQLQARLETMCAFANGETPEFFVHPAVRAILLHFWLAYDHPFIDGNGRTARALFYWEMLHSNYPFFEFISISNSLRKAPAQYANSFLYTENDENDLTYFIVAQTRVIRQAIQGLRDYVDTKTRELQALESQNRTLNLLNQRQAELVRHALAHPKHVYTFAGHQRSHRVAYQTARTDLMGLAEFHLLEQRKKGKQMVYAVPADLVQRLRTPDLSTGSATPTTSPPS